MGALYPSQSYLLASFGSNLTQDVTSKNMDDKASDRSLPHVYLLRESTRNDPFEAAFQEAGFQVSSVPVLSYVMVNQEQLRTALEHPDVYSGLVLTSPRAVQALDEALCWLPSETALWHTKPVFVVGPRTAADVRAIGFDPAGADSGSAHQLADYLVAASFSAPLLYLCGNRRRDTLSSRLQTASIPFEELCVYETHLRTDAKLDDIAPGDWVVFFSPSGIEAVVNMKGSGVLDGRKAAIGPTTADALRQAGWRVDAEAAEPEPETLALAILKAAP